MFESMTNTTRRANRLEYLFGVLLLYVGYMIAMAFMNVGLLLGVIGFMALIALSVLQIILTKNRFNDFGYSGWWMLVPFASLVAFFVPGDLTDNRFGRKV
jgi:uncharacterized membrane protein YhaH (DUF805 family)